METCKLCFSEKIVTVKKVQSPHVDHQYKLYECKSCKSRFFDHLEYPVSLFDVYEKMSPQRNVEVEYKETKYWKERGDVLVKQLGREPKSLLDVGCETGDFLMLFPKVQSRQGVELSKSSVDIATKRGLIVHNDFLENIEFDQKFEVVTAFAILEHLAEPHKFLNKLETLVEDNGILLILIPTHQCFKAKFMNFIGRKWKMNSPPEHLNFYSRLFLDKHLSEKGYALEKRYFDSGGNFNPLSQIPFVGHLTTLLIKLADKWIFAKVPFFDHMYSIYKKKQTKEIENTINT